MNGMQIDWLIPVRAVHFAACLLIFGVWAFDRLVLGSAPEVDGAWPSFLRRVTAWALFFAALSGLAWYLLVTAAMSGLPGFPSWEALEIVRTKTAFGAVWQFHLGFILALAFILWPFYWRKNVDRTSNGLAWTALLLNAAILGSIAWSGHGKFTQLSQSNLADWHLTADLIHLLAAGFWPTGLVPLLFLICRNSPTIDSRQLLRRFSAWSLAAVALLAATGLANTWFLIPTPSALITTPYGQLLSVKIILFLLMIGLGALNFFSRKPTSSSSPLPRQIIWELLLSTLIILLTAFLGVTPPPKA